MCNSISSIREAVYQITTCERSACLQSLVKQVRRLKSRKRTGVSEVPINHVRIGKAIESYAQDLGHSALRPANVARCTRAHLTHDLVVAVLTVVHDAEHDAAPPDCMPWPCLEPRPPPRKPDGARICEQRREVS